MQNITFALGLRCIDCHDVNDLSLDTKPRKVKARMMLEMVRDIPFNLRKFPPILHRRKSAIHSALEMRH